MSDRLEEMLVRQRNRFKSEGERRIARFLDDNAIRYHYEPGVLVKPYDDKPRIWYPDFHLPEFAAYIEYFGLIGKQNYDEGVKTKLSTYRQMGLDVIPIYPWTFTDNWQAYIMTELERTTLHRYNCLKSKKYWSPRDSPSQQRRGTRTAYGRGFGQRY